MSFKITMLLMFSGISFSHASNISSSELAEQSCQKLQQLIAENSALNIQSQYVQVPISYDKPETQSTFGLFLWHRPGRNSAYPPLVFFHGGTGGSSNLVFELPKMKELLQNYPGSFYALDLRGESCSKPKGLNSNLHPSVYRPFNIHNTALDIEFLRLNNYFGDAGKIRIFGQSRGAALVHHYFSMYPNNVESAHAHGFSIEAAKLGMNGVRTRANGMLNSWKNYLKKYPQDEDLAFRIKAKIPESKCWVGVDNTQICGPESLGILGILFGRVITYDGIHKALTDMTDESGEPQEEKIFKIIGDRWLGTTYKEFNYVMGTNGYDLASLGASGAEQLRAEKDPAYFAAPFSEIRFINEAIVKQYQDQNGTVRGLSDQDLAESYLTIDYSAIKKSLRKNPEQKFFLYGSQYDGIAPLPMFDYAIGKLSRLPNFKFTVLPNGHEDFEHEKIMNNLMKANY